MVKIEEVVENEDDEYDNSGGDFYTSVKKTEDRLGEMLNGEQTVSGAGEAEANGNEGQEEEEENQ